MTDNTNFYKKVINNGLFQNKDLMTSQKKQRIMEKIYLERNRNVVKRKRMKDAIGIIVCCSLLFFTGQFAWGFIDMQGNQSQGNHSQEIEVLKPIPAKEGELSGKDWANLSDQEKYNLIGDVLRNAGLTTSEIRKDNDLRFLKEQLDLAFKLNKHQNTGVNSAILYLYNKFNKGD